jgi:hypothetical protein
LGKSSRWKKPSARVLLAGKDYCEMLEGRSSIRHVCWRFWSILMFMLSWDCVVRCGVVALRLFVGFICSISKYQQLEAPVLALPRNIKKNSLLVIDRREKFSSVTFLGPTSQNGLYFVG